MSSLNPEISVTKSEINKKPIDKLNRLHVFANLSTLFDEQLWQEQNNLKICQLITTIVTTIAQHLDDQFTFPCGNFLIKIDYKNKEHLFIDKNRREAICVTKKALGMQVLRIPYQTKKN